jgi:glutathione S-transferase
MGGAVSSRENALLRVFEDEEALSSELQCARSEKHELRHNAYRAQVRGHELGQELTYYQEKERDYGARKVKAEFNLASLNENLEGVEKELKKMEKKANKKDKKGKEKKEKKDKKGKAKEGKQDKAIRKLSEKQDEVEALRAARDKTDGHLKKLDKAHTQAIEMGEKGAEERAQLKLQQDIDRSKQWAAGKAIERVNGSIGITSKRKINIMCDPDEHFAPHLVPKHGIQVPAPENREESELAIEQCAQSSLKRQAPQLAWHYMQEEYQREVESRYRVRTADELNDKKQVELYRHLKRVYQELRWSRPRVYVMGPPVARPLRSSKKPQGDEHMIGAGACPFCMQLQLLLGAKGVEYDVISVPFESTPQWFLKYSPNGILPVIACDLDVVVGLKPALEWVQKRFAAPKYPLVFAKDGTEEEATGGPRYEDILDTSPDECGSSSGSGSGSSSSAPVVAVTGPQEEPIAPPASATLAERLMCAGMQFMLADDLEEVNPETEPAAKKAATSGNIAEFFTTLRKLQKIKQNKMGLGYVAPPQTEKQKRERAALRRTRLAHLAESEGELVTLLTAVQHHLNMNSIRGGGPFVRGSRKLSDADCELFPRLWLVIAGLKYHKPEWRLPSEFKELRLYHKMMQAQPEWNKVLCAMAPGAVDAMVAMALDPFRGSKSDTMFGSVQPGRPLRKPLPHKMRERLTIRIGEEMVVRLEQGPVHLSMGKSPAQLEALCSEIATVCMQLPDQDQLWQLLFQLISYITMARLHPQLPTAGEFVAPNLLELYLRHMKLEQLLQYPGAITQAQHVSEQTRAAIADANKTEEQRAEDLRRSLYGSVVDEPAGADAGDKIVKDDGKSFWWEAEEAKGLKTPWPKKGDEVPEDFFTDTKTPSTGLPLREKKPPGEVTEDISLELSDEDVSLGQDDEDNVSIDFEDEEVEEDEGSEVVLEDSENEEMLDGSEVGLDESEVELEAKEELDLGDDL